MDFSKKNERNVLFAVTFGNLLEWYEIYLYVYWSPIIAKLFFNPETESTNLITTFFVFALGLLARPFGGLFFGRLGDIIGRKKSFMLSLIMMTFPTIISGLLPTYAQVGVLAPIFLTCTRFLQAFPAGGEIPGAFCYLYESTAYRERRFYCSWACIGVLSGLLLSSIECFTLELLLKKQDLITWGWRSSFLFGGVIGLSGIVIRSRLHETPLYQEMSKHLHVSKESILQIFYRQRKRLALGILLWMFNSSTIFFITVNTAEYFKKMLQNNNLVSIGVSSAILMLIIISLPFFGFIADKFNNKKLLIWSIVASVLLLIPLCYFVVHTSLYGLILTVIIFTLLFSCNTAILSYTTPELFPTHLRYTCVAVSFNITDAVVGGFTPFLILYFTQLTNYKGAFSLVLLFFAVISLISYILMKERHPIKD